MFMLIYTIYKSKDRVKHLTLFSTYIGFAYIFEYIIVALFDGYHYKPKFLKDKYLDSYLGSICSQYFYVPVTALFITVFRLGWKSKLSFSLYFSLIEKLFIRLGIFKNNWWKTSYTFLAIFISFFLNDLWYKQLKKANPLMLFLSFFNLIQVTWMNMLYMLYAIKQVRYQLGWFDFFEKTPFKIAPAVGLLKSIVLTQLLKKSAFASKIISFIFLLTFDWVLIQKKMIKVRSYLILPLTYIIIIGSSVFYKRMVFGRIVNRTE
ncbi:MAG: hypothetical protein LPK26_14225 [Bacillaceae bacterium]|nr:hypothetical protein [Bacillaceae bacterium]